MPPKKQVRVTKPFIFKDPEAMKRLIIYSTYAFNRLFVPIVAIFSLYHIFGIFMFILHNKIPQENRDVLMIVIGGLLTAFSTLFTFYFSNSSKHHGKTK